MLLTILPVLLALIISLLNSLSQDQFPKQYLQNVNLPVIKKRVTCKQFHEAGYSPTCMFYSYIILWNTLYSTKINDVRIGHRAVTKGWGPGDFPSVNGQCEHDPQIHLLKTNGQTEPIELPSCSIPSLLISHPAN